MQKCLCFRRFHRKGSGVRQKQPDTLFTGRVMPSPRSRTVNGCFNLDVKKVSYQKKARRSKPGCPLNDAVNVILR